MTASKCGYRALLIALPLLAACEVPATKSETPAAQATPRAAAADSVAKHPGCYSETPCYQLVPFRGELFTGPVDIIRSSRYRGVVYVSVQADTLHKQLTNFQLAFVRLTDKQKGQELKWHRGGAELAPAELLRLLPQFRRRILATRVRVVTSTDTNCVMPSHWMLPFKVI